MAVVLRALTLLGVIGASCALFVQEMVGDWVRAFVSANTMSMHNRTHLLVGMAAGAGVGVIVGLLVFWRRDERRLQRLAHLLAPAMLIGLVPQLTDRQAWTNTLNICLVLGVFVLLAERLYRISLGALAETPPNSAVDAPPSWWTTLVPPRVRRVLPPVLVVLGALAYGIYFSIFTLRMHGRFQTYNFDLGQYDNIFWSTMHGYPMRDWPLGLTKNWTELRNHASLSVFVLLPFYAIKPGGATLLVIQSFVVALGAIPLYRFTTRRLPRVYAVVIAFAYLLYPPTHGMQFYDFHFQPIAATCVLFVIDLVDDRRYWLCAIAFIIAAGCREDVSVGLAMLGTFLALSGHRVKPGLAIAVAGATYFVLIRFVIMPSFGGWGFQDLYKDLMPAGAHSFGGIIATIVSNPTFTFVSLTTPEKLRYMLQILLPLALLPVRRTYLIASVIPGSIFTILTTQYPPTIDIGFQYSAHYTPYVFTAAVVCIASFGYEGAGLIRRRAALGALLTGTIMSGVFWGAIPPRVTVHGGFSMMTMQPPTAADRQKDKYIKELEAMVPRDASLAIGEAEMTHVSRLKIKGLRDSTDADYLLHSPGAGGDRALTSGEFEKIAERPGGLVLYRRRKTPAAPPAPPPGSLSAPPPPAVQPSLPAYGGPAGNKLAPRPPAVQRWGPPGAPASAPPLSAPPHSPH
jgi:uncharacterized membrane protein